MIKNGIYLTLILFLGVMGYFVVNDLYMENSTTLASVIFLTVSVVIAVLTTHFKRKAELATAQKVINVVYISLFALYGVVVGISLMYAPSYELSMIRFEGGLFIVASMILIYGVFMFIKRHTYHGHFL